MIECQPGVKNASSGPRRLSYRQTMRFDGDTIRTRLLLRSAINTYPGTGPAGTGGRRSACQAGLRGAGRKAAAIAAATAAASPTLLFSLSVASRRLEALPAVRAR